MKIGTAKRPQLNIKGLESNYYLLLNPIVLDISISGSSFQGAGDNLSVATVTFTYGSETITQKITLVNSKGILRIDEALLSIIKKPKINSLTSNQEGMYRIGIGISVVSGSASFSSNFNKNFIFGGANLNALQHRSNLYVNENTLLTGGVVPMFDNMTTYASQVSLLQNIEGNLLRSVAIREGVAVQLGDNCDMQKRVRFRNRIGGVGVWIFNNFTIKPNEEGYSNYKDAIYGYSHAEGGETYFDVTLHSKARKELRPYIEGIIGSFDIQVEDFKELDEWENNNVKGGPTSDWLTMNYVSCNITEDSNYITIELNLTTNAGN